MQLIYHRIGSSKVVSPFDQALQEVASGAPLLRLASPYIGLPFLQRTIQHVVDWRLLSDVDAWLHSGNRKHRAKCWEFIADNLGRIRHVANLHAKVAIGNNKLFLGSANFTEMGILGRAELSILIAEAEQVEESIAWFDELWNIASPPIMEEGDALVSALDSLEWTQPKVRVKLTTTAPQIAAILAETKRPDGFDLAGVMAKAGITESVTLGSLAEAYQRISDEWGNGGRSFTFRELLDAANRLAAGSAREVWELITTDTVNHWLGGLDPGGFDRYVYESGKFRLFRAPSDNGTAIKPAKILNFLLDAIPMSPDHEPLPFESAWLEVGVAEAQILPVVELLLEIGFLVEHDAPGEIESYSIDHGFEWPTRWDKFVKARNRFEMMLENFEPRPSATLEDEPDVGEYPDEMADIPPRTIIWDKKPLGKKPPIKNKSTDRAVSQINETNKRASQLGLKPTEMLAQHDLVLSDLIVNGIQQGANRQQINQDLQAKQIVGSVRGEFIQPGRALINTKAGGLKLNPNWEAEFYLRLYPKALNSWRELILRG